MVVYFVIIATLNFGVGFVLAAWRCYTPSAATPTITPPTPAASSEEEASISVAPESPAASAPDPTPSLVMRSAASDEPGEAPPASDGPAPAQSTRLEDVFAPALAMDVFDFRCRLVEILEQASQASEIAAADRLWEDFQSLNKAWSESSAAARELLEGRREMVEDCKIWAERLIASLSRMEHPGGSPGLLLMDNDAGPGAARRNVVQEGLELLEESHTLRDVQYEARLAVLQWCGNLDSVSPEQLRDPQTRLHNRLGLEVVHRDWMLQHPRSTWSVAVLDVDDFGEINRRFGPWAGDRLLAAFGYLVDDLLRKDSGFDRAGRYGGDSFVLFLGDTSVESAINAAERIRQMIESSTFVLGDEELNLTVSVGAAAGSGREILADVLFDAMEAAREAKEEGGNRTARHTEFGPQTEPARPYEIRGRVIRVDTMSTEESPLIV